MYIRVWSTNLDLRLVHIGRKIGDNDLVGRLGGGRGSLGTICGSGSSTSASYWAIR